MNINNSESHSEWLFVLCWNWRVPVWDKPNL